MAVNNYNFYGITGTDDNDENNYYVREKNYAICSTAAATAAKTADLDGFVLEAGVSVRVKFTNANTASSPTLNVNSTGAIPIMRYGTTAAGTTVKDSWRAGQIVTFAYDGTNWIMADFADRSDTTYSNATTSNDGLMSAEDKQAVGHIGEFSKSIPFTGTSFDDIPLGLYYITNGTSMANVPATADYWYVISFSNRHQFAIPLTGTIIYRRHHTNVNDPWSAWSVIDTRYTDEARVYQGTAMVPNSSEGGTLKLHVPTSTYAFLVFVGATVGTHNWGVVGLYSPSAAQMRTVLLSNSSDFESVSLSAGGSNKLVISNSAQYGCRVFWFGINRIYVTT